MGRMPGSGPGGGGSNPPPPVSVKTKGMSYVIKNFFNIFFCIRCLGG